MIELLAYPAFALFMLVLVATGVFPRTRWNSKESYNQLSRVLMQPAAYYASTNQSIHGVHAQERVECFLRWLTFLTVVGAVVLNTRWFFRQSEFIGHAAEIVVAGRNGFDRDEYLHDEAARTYRNRGSYKGIFDHLDLEGMKRALRKRFFIARVLVAINSLAIART